MNYQSNHDKIRKLAYINPTIMRALTVSIAENRDWEDTLVTIIEALAAHTEELQKQHIKLISEGPPPLVIPHQ